MSSTEATDGFISEFIASDGFHEAAINSGYIHKDEIKEIIQNSIGEVLDQKEMMGMDVFEEGKAEAYIQALQDLAKSLEIEL